MDNAFLEETLGAEKMSLLGAIDIGSHTIKLKIIEVNELNQINVLEDLKSEIMFGLDSFRNKRISRHAILEATKILQYYSRMMTEYGVERVRTVATGSVREAENGQFVVDQLSKKTRLDIEILAEPIERSLTYLALKYALPQYADMRKEGMLLVEVGSGSSEVIIYKSGKLVRNNEVRLGTMLLKNMIREIEAVSLFTPLILQDYAFAHTENLQGYLTRKKISHFVAVGGSIKVISDAFKKKGEGLERKYFDKIFNSLMQEESEFKRCIIDLDIDYEEVLSAFVIFQQFLNHTSAEFVHIPDVSLRDGILYEMMENKSPYDRKSEYTKDIISAAKHISKRYHSTTSHIKMIDDNVIKLFAALRNSEDFDNRDLLLLRISTILHETGKFNKQSEYYQSTYENIKNASILGVSDSMMEIAARISLNSFTISSEGSLSGNEQLLFNDTKLLKLAAIQSLADALDKSKKQSLIIHQVKLTDDTLKISIEKLRPCFFEEFAVDAMMNSFYEIFGYDILLKDVKS